MAFCPRSSWRLACGWLVVLFVAVVGCAPGAEPSDEPADEAGARRSKLMIWLTRARVTPCRRARSAAFLTSRVSISRCHSRARLRASIIRGRVARSARARGPQAWPAASGDGTQPDSPGFAGDSAWHAAPAGSGFSSSSGAGCPTRSSNGSTRPARCKRSTSSPVSAGGCSTRFRNRTTTSGPTRGRTARGGSPAMRTSGG